MPIRNYGVVKGHPQRGELVFDRNGKNPHYRIYLNGGSATSQADVNVESQDGSEVLYEINRAFVPPSTGALAGLPMGFSPIDPVPGGLALDYVREKTGGSFMVQRADMNLLPIPGHGNGQQLKNAVAELLNEAVADERGTILAFGSEFRDPNGVSGIHDIHMNQGNPPGNFEGDNGTWQDGAVWIQLSSEPGWIALFIAFQSQSWQTDAKGNPI
jgi:uncharacterized protein YukJ